MSRESASRSKREAATSGQHWWRSVLAGMVGAVVGAVIGGVVAVNFVIFSGIEGGYEASLTEVFDQSVPIGVITLLIFGGVPLAGAIWAVRWSHRSESDRSGSA